MLSTNSPRTRHWSDLLALLTGVALIGVVIWPGGPTANNAAAEELRFPVAAWMVLGSAGFLALAGATVAQRWSLRGLGRGLIAVGGVLLLVNLFFVRDFGVRALLTLLLPGVALLAAAFGAGPMPRDLGPDYDATRRADLPRTARDSGAFAAERQVDIAHGTDTETRTQRNYGPGTSRDERPSV